MLGYQLEEGRERLVYVAKDHTEAGLRGFFDILDDTALKASDISTRQLFWSMTILRLRFNDYTLVGL